MGGWSNNNQTSNGIQKSIHSDTSPDRLRSGPTHDLFELLEKAQCARLDDQRCVLPAYFSQVSFFFFFFCV